MRLKLDENLPRRVERFLENAGHDCSTVVEEGLGGAVDSQVVAAATGEGRMVVSLDRGFGDVRAYPPGSHPGILVLHVSDQAPGMLVEALQAFLSDHHLDEFEGCVVILEAGRIRVRRPPEGR